MVWVNTDVDVDLECFDDEDIRDEFYKRNLGGGADTWDEVVELNKAYQLHHDGKTDKAYEILWRMCLEKLNKVV